MAEAALKSFDNFFVAHKLYCRIFRACPSIVKGFKFRCELGCLRHPTGDFWPS